MSDIIWHKEITMLDVAATIPELKPVTYNPTKFYQMTVNQGSEIREQALQENPSLSVHDFRGGAELIEQALEYCWLKFGRPTWFIDKEMFDLLSTCKIEDDDLSDLVFPWDVFSIIFEKGIEIAGYPLRTMRVAAMKSPLSMKIVHEVFPYFVHDNRTIHFYFDFGEEIGTKKCSQDTDPGLMMRWHWFRAFKGEHTLPDAVSRLTKEETNACSEAIKIASAALMYYSARPDLVVDHTLPRSQRYQHKGERKNFKRVLLPTVKKVYPLGATDPLESGRTVTGHYRGWVLRTLRHEKYTRNPDGSCKRILVPPTAVKGGPPESNEQI